MAEIAEGGESERAALVADLAAQVRQAVGVCSSHTVGPVAAFARCLAYRRDDKLSEEQFRSIGREIVERSAARLEELADNQLGVTSAIRERRIIDFVSALFGLDDTGVSGHGNAKAEHTAALSTPMMELVGRRKLGVVGKGRNCPPATYQLAYEVGSLLGQHRDDLLLLTGGLGGVMEAAARGFHDAGGFVIGVLPGSDYQTTEPTRQGLGLAIDTGLSVHVRNIVIGSAVDLLVALPGSHGTLQETIVALDLGRPVLALGEHRSRIEGVHYLTSLGELAKRVDRWLAPGTGQENPDTSG